MIHCFVTSFPRPIKFRHEIIVVGDAQMFYTHTYICFVTGINFDCKFEIGIIGLFIRASLYRTPSM